MAVQTSLIAAVIIAQVLGLLVSMAGIFGGAKIVGVKQGKFTDVLGITLFWWFTFLSTCLLGIWVLSFSTNFGNLVAVILGEVVVFVVAFAGTACILGYVLKTNFGKACYLTIIGWSWEVLVIGGILFVVLAAGPS